MTIRILALLGAGLVSSGSAWPQADLRTPESLLVRYADALGGASAVNAVRTRVMRGCYLPTGETPCVPFDVYSSAGKWKTVMTAPGILRQERIGSGESAFELDSSGEQPLKPETAAEQALAFSHHAQLRPESRLTGLRVTRANVLEGRNAAGQAVELEFDAETGLLSRIGNYQLLDYRPVDGVKSPFTIQNVKSRVRYSFLEVRHNAPIGDAVFTSAPFQPLQSAMRKPALEEAIRGIDVTPAERAQLEEHESFSPHEGRLLFDMIRQHGYKRGLEIGTAYGNSAIWLAMALKRNGGKLITIEREAEYAKVARGSFEKAGLMSAIDSRVNDAFKEIPALSGDFDLVFMDTGTSLHRQFLELVSGRVKPGGMIISHNADTFERDQPDFRKAVMEDPRLETSLMLTPGGGMSVSIVRALPAQ